MDPNSAHVRQLALLVLTSENIDSAALIHFMYHLFGLLYSCATLRRWRQYMAEA